MTDPTPSKPILSGTAATICGLAGTALAALGVGLPAPWGTLTSIVGFLLAGLAGAAAKAPDFAAGKPLVQGTIATVLGTAEALIEHFYASIPPAFQPIAVAVAAFLAFLVGKSMPPLGSPSHEQLAAATAAGDAAGSAVKTPADAVKALQ